MRLQVALAFVAFLGTVHATRIDWEPTLHFHVASREQAEEYLVGINKYVEGVSIRL